jgi:nucleoside phosphorylase
MTYDIALHLPRAAALQEWIATRRALAQRAIELAARADCAEKRRELQEAAAWEMEQAAVGQFALETHLKQRQEAGA